MGVYPLLHIDSQFIEIGRSLITGASCFEMKFMFASVCVKIFDVSFGSNGILPLLNCYQFLGPSLHRGPDSLKTGVELGHMARIL